MKSIFTYLLLILFLYNINAQQLQQLDCGSIVFGENLKEVKPSATLTDIIYDATSRNREGDIIDAPDVILRSNALVASLHLLSKTDPSLDQLFDSVKVRVIISFKNIKDGVIKTKTQFLKIENTDKNSIGKDQIILENVDWASITVDSFYCSNPELVSTHFQFTTFIMGERNLRPNRSTVMIPPFFSRSVNKAYIGVTWSEINWATMYDLEWTFVDKYDKNQTPVFRNNATRVRVDSTGYEIPSIFPEGKLFCRVRAVGKDEKNQIITNDWSNTSSALPINEAEVFEQYSKTYQHIASFSEEGKRKDMVSYFDGTSRTRQMVTKLNTDGNPALVAETYYDHEGRQAIVSLPAPYKPEPTYELVGIFSPGSLTASTGFGPYYPNINDLMIGNNFYNPDLLSNIGSIGNISDILDWTKIKDYYSSSPSLSYKSNFNLNENGKPFSKLDFDFLAEVDDCKTALVTPKMSQTSGAGKYYSEANDFDSAIHNDFVPNADGYPYFQTIYTPDKTGRKEMAGMAGDILRIGGGHETKVTYVNPSQDELDRVFGNDVGYADNYLKVVTTDPNGQASVSYTNSKGQVIATALSGNNPDNLRAVEKDPNFTNTIDVVAQNNNLDYNFESSLATQTFYIDQDRTNVNISYTIDPASLNMNVSCETGRFCYDCVRNVTIKLKDECGELIMDKIIELGSITDTTSTNLARCNYTGAFTFTDSRVLNKGTYTITKKLSINLDNRDTYIDHFIKKDTACFKPTLEPSSCLPPPTCVECIFGIVENNNIKALKRNTGNNINCIYQCPENKKPVYDMDTYASLLRDMRPGGQYGCIDATSVGKFKVSVFNTLNILRSNNDIGADMNYDYKHPFFPYLNADGSEAKINCNTLNADEYVEAEAFVVDGQRFVRPQSINLQKLSEIWQESWAESLIPYHPEYAYLEWSNDNMTAQNFNTLINNTVSYEDAVNNGLFPMDEVLNASFVNNDPYMSANPTASTTMLTTLSAIGEGEHVYNIFEMTKQITVCDLPVYKTSRSAMMACISGIRIENFTSEQKQFAWETFKGIYMGKRAVIVDEQRNAALATSVNRLHGRLNNFCVDETSFIDRCLPCESGSDDLKSLLKKAQRKILHPLCWANRAGTAVISTPDGRRWVTADEARGYAIMDWITCSNTCPLAFEFMTFVNAVAMQRQITDPFTITDYPSIKLPEVLINGFANPRSTSYLWVPQVISSNKMIVDILDKKDSQAKWEFSSDSKVPWKDLKFFSCLNNLEAKSTLGSPSDGMYSISVFDQESKEYKLKLKIIRGFDFVNCSTIPLSVGILSIEKGKFYYSDPKNNKQKEPRQLNPNAIKGRHKLMCCLKPSLKIVPARPCESTSQLIAQAEILALKIEKARGLKDSLTLAYNKKCMTDVNEHLTVSFDQPIYHYTLFYYDQAGNLIKSVPPKAINLLNNSKLGDVNNGRSTTTKTYPEHNDALTTAYTYNSFNKKLTRRSPDDGMNTYVYDEVGRVIMSQTAVQKDDNKISYSIFDPINRPLEGGVCAASTLRSMMTGKIKYKAYESAVLAASGKTEVIKTFFDQVHSTDVQNEFTDGKQQNLKKRVASVYYKESGVPTPSDYDHGLHFNYDKGGNVKEILTDFKAMSRIMGDESLNVHEKKLTRYHYDLLTGKVNQIIYQPEKADQFIHWYRHDADNRLINVATGRNKFEPIELIENDMSYEYYLHGPVARASLGKENIQALDLVYTINGWLKQVNAPSRNISMDPASDGPGNSFLGDVYGYQLSYFDNDYDAIKRSSTTSHPFADNPSLYNGNIRAITTRNDQLIASPGGAISCQLYSYDQLGRLSQSRFGESGVGLEVASTGWSDVHTMSWAVGDKYGMNLTYDKNGNIRTLVRRDGASTIFDNLTYENYTNNNRLNYINDLSGAANPTIKDLGSQSVNNYRYDSSGRLISDNASNGATMSWSQRDKLKTYTDRDGATSFFYDALGRRSLKKGSTESTYTVRDFNGNTQAIYTIKNGQVFLDEIPIYASSRIGTWQPEALSVSRMDTMHIRMIRGEKVYELKNQVGDINVLVSDHRILNEDGEDAGYRADVVMAQDYFPFGMEMPGRSTGKEYRYGFQGMEQDNDLKGEGNSYTTEYRQYDPRIGRWLSVDPMMEKYADLSPYVAFDNNPIMYVDPYGDIAEISAQDHQQLRSAAHEVLSESSDQYNRVFERLSQSESQLNTIDARLNVISDQHDAASNRERRQLNRQREDALRQYASALTSIREAQDNLIQEILGEFRSNLYFLDMNNSRLTDAYQLGQRDLANLLQISRSGIQHRNPGTNVMSREDFIEYHANGTTIAAFIARLFGADEETVQNIGALSNNVFELVSCYASTRRPLNPNSALDGYDGTQSTDVPQRPQEPQRTAPRIQSETQRRTAQSREARRVSQAERARQSGAGRRPGR